MIHGTKHGKGGENEGKMKGKTIPIHWKMKIIG
jgi:hypothetical protein